MVISQKPGLRSVIPISDKRNSSLFSLEELELLVLQDLLESSKRRSITQNTKKASKPIMRKANATNNGVEREK